MYRSFVIIGILFMCTIETAMIIPRSYIVEYVPDHDTIDLTQYRDLYDIHHTYSSSIFHGMSFSLKDKPQAAEEPHISPASYSAADKSHPVYNHLQNHPAIKKIYPIYEVPRTQWMPNSKPNVYTFPYSNKDSQIYDVHQKLGTTGQGILVGILDSGVDYYHPALGGGFGEGFKIRYGRNLVAASSDEENGVKPLGEDDPYDPCKSNDAGHGTHVSGIIAGYDPEKNFTGIAPNATLGMWRIFGCQGGAEEDTVIKAMEMAYDAGCKIINLSLGIENGWPEDAMSVVAENLSKKGVIVVGVAGNQGSDGAYSANSPATGRSVAAVASVGNSFYPSQVLNVDILPNENFSFMFSSNTASFPNGTLASVFNNGSFPNGCKDDVAINSDNSDGKILLVKRGNCTFDEKLEYAERMGAVGVLFYDPEVTENSLIVAKTKNNSLPCADIEYKLVTQLISYYEGEKAKPVEVTFPLVKKIVVPDSAGAISDFSSTGPTYELDLKPTITGIGGDVYSTLPMHIDDGFGVRSGTSMASPHVAGAAALLTEYYTKQKINVTSSFIMDHLKNHAKLVETKSGLPEHPLVQGAGLIRPYDAIMSKVHVTPSQISFNDTASLTEYKSYSISILNQNDSPLLVTLENIQTNSIQSYANDSSFVPTEPAWKNGTVNVSLEFTPSAHTILLPPSATTLVQVKVILPDPSSLFYHYQMYGGYLSVKDVQTKESLATVPYFGVLGKMIDIPLFDKGFPYLANANTTDEKVSKEKPYQFDISRRKTTPAIVVRLLTGSANMEIKVYDVEDKYMGILSGGPWIYNQRNTLAEENFHSTIQWNGEIIPDTNERAIVDYEELVGHKTVQIQDGTYYIRVRALKHFGDSSNQNDWEEWKSGPINVSS